MHFHRDAGLTVEPQHRHDITGEQADRARHTTARYATGPSDLRTLLEMLGLTPEQAQAELDTQDAHQDTP